MGNKIARTIQGLDEELWRQFTYWAKRLGYIQADLFAELMRFYFEKNKKELEEKLSTIEIKVKVKKFEKTHEVSSYCKQDIDAILQYYSSKEKTEKGINEKIAYLSKEYLQNLKHPKADREAIKELISKIGDKNDKNAEEL